MSRLETCPRDSNNTRACRLFTALASCRFMRNRRFFSCGRSARMMTVSMFGLLGVEDSPPKETLFFRLSRSCSTSEHYPLERETCQLETALARSVSEGHPSL